MDVDDSGDRPLFLLVEDSDLEARAISRVLRSHAQIGWARTLAEATPFMHEPALAAALVDWKLPDGSGLTVVTALKAAFPHMPVLVLTAHLDADCINRTHLLRAEYVCKPPSRANLISFAERALENAASSPDKNTIASQVAAAHELSTSEKEVLRLALGGVPRAQLPERLGVSENTTKTIVRRLLTKTDEPTLQALVRRILEEALRA